MKVRACPHCQGTGRLPDADPLEHLRAACCANGFPVSWDGRVREDATAALLGIETKTFETGAIRSTPRVTGRPILSLLARLNGRSWAEQLAEPRGAGVKCSKPSPANRTRTRLIINRDITRARATRRKSRLLAQQTTNMALPRLMSPGARAVRARVNYGWKADIGWDPNCPSLRSGSSS